MDMNDKGSASRKAFKIRSYKRRKPGGVYRVVRVRKNKKKGRKM